MPVEGPPSFRARVEDWGDALRIIIPTQKYCLLIGFMGFWVIGWALGELWLGVQLVGLLFTNAAGMVAEQGPAALLLYAWFGGWTISGLLVLYGFLWFVAGRETIDINSEAIIVRRKVLGIGRSKRYPAGRAGNLRASPVQDSRIAPGVWSVGGPIAFDYEGKTLRFGAGVGEVEANQLVKLVLERFPDYLPE